MREVKNLRGRGRQAEGTAAPKALRLAHGREGKEVRGLQREPGAQQERRSGEGAAVALASASFRFLGPRDTTEGVGRSLRPPVNSASVA